MIGVRISHQARLIDHDRAVLTPQVPNKIARQSAITRDHDIPITKPLAQTLAPRAMQHDHSPLRRKPREFRAPVAQQGRSRHHQHKTGLIRLRFKQMLNHRNGLQRFAKTHVIRQQGPTKSPHTIHHPRRAR